MEEKNLTTKKISDERTGKCVICECKADLELEDGRFICDNCAQIQGELSDE